jgi:hypothetical protein
LSPTPKLRRELQFPRATLYSWTPYCPLKTMHLYKMIRMHEGKKYALYLRSPYAPELLSFHECIQALVLGCILPRKFGVGDKTEAVVLAFEAVVLVGSTLKTQQWTLRSIWALGDLQIFREKSAEKRQRSHSACLCCSPLERAQGRLATRQHPYTYVLYPFHTIGLRAALIAVCFGSPYCIAPSSRWIPSVQSSQSKATNARFQCLPHLARGGILALSLSSVPPLYGRSSPPPLKSPNDIPRRGHCQGMPLS